MAKQFSYPSYVGGTDSDDIDRAFEAIVDALISDDAHFLFGAGMSRESDVPTGLGVGKDLLRVFFPSTGANPPTDERLGALTTEFPLEAIAEAVEKNLGGTRDDLTNVLKKILIEPDFPVSDAHKEFVSICYWWGRPIPNQVFTTNFDSLLEEVFTTDRAVPITEENATDIKKLQQKGLLPIIHLHGTLETQYQITETDVFDTRVSILNNEFQTALFNARAFVFVGYSMMDPDYRRIYREYRSEWRLRKNNSDKKTYVVLPPNDGFSYRLGKKIWEERGAEWIPLGAVEFFAKLKDLMSTHAEADARKEIMSKYRIQDEGALENLIETTMRILGGTRQDGIGFLLQTRTSLGGAK